jgi:hypothetical protein
MIRMNSGIYHSISNIMQQQYKNNGYMKEQSFASWLIDRKSFPVVFLYLLFAVVSLLLFFSGLIHEQRIQ